MGCQEEKKVADIYGKAKWGKPREKQFVPGCTGIRLNDSQRVTMTTLAKGAYVYCGHDNGCRPRFGGRTPSGQKRS
jgi:hypothetical protein